MAGNAPKRWIFLRGLSREKRHWGDLLPRFEKEIGKCVAVDLPGTGSKNSLTSPLSVSAITDSLLAEVGESEDTAVLAMSMGAMVALDWLSRFPKTFSRAVLINTSLSGKRPLFERLRPTALRGGLQFLLGPTPEIREGGVLHMTANNGAVRERALKNWVEISTTSPVSRINVIRQLWAAKRAEVDVTKISTPVLLLASEKDRVASVSCSKNLAHQKQWPIQIHPTAGHDIPLEDPTWVVNAVKDWLKV